MCIQVLLITSSVSTDVQSRAGMYIRVTIRYLYVGLTHSSGTASHGYSSCEKVSESTLPLADNRGVPGTFSTAFWLMRPFEDLTRKVQGLVLEVRDKACRGR